ncbi:hypothetical protein GCM10007298_38750 [Williamsia phyllosphaerae]|uniref:Uncharacterized protein n=1 Tax=Williamsia phyllosphaerae TaxID=885042 RepID=A0ABQ1V6K0_9NOCA|nr:hypothetical protein GCM10007298_38750 [Williamsia phyllosphaerae]
MSAPTPRVPTRCQKCGRPWRTWFYERCDQGPDCWECGMEFRSVTKGWHADYALDCVEVVAWSCPHGTMFEQRCHGCGVKVSAWGVGAAGFGELCGCKVDA